MPLKAEAVPAARPVARQNLARLAVTFAALATVAATLALLLWLFTPAVVPTPPRNPFGLGVREAAPAPGGLGGVILALQASFYGALRNGIAAVRADRGAFYALLGVAFGYGVFHAAGPGHGKAVIAGYLAAHEGTLAKGFGLSLAAATVQALVAIGLVAVLGLLLNATAATMGRITNAVELASFVVIFALGGVVTWRKAGIFLDAATPALAASGLQCGHGGMRWRACSCVALPSPLLCESTGSTQWREIAGVALAAGLRPCAGAIVVLVFASAQGLFAAGIAATFVMALGTAVTTGLIAMLAVFGRKFLLRFAQWEQARARSVVAGAELLVAACVAAVGLSLLLGVWTSGAS